MSPLHDTKQSLDCRTDDSVRRYLAGKTSDDEASRIEAHLAECSECQQRIERLEAEPEPLVQSLRNRAAAVGEVDSHADQPAEIAAALQRAERLLDPGHRPTDWLLWRPPVDGLGPYELLRPLASGGMGAVFVGLHRQLGKQVAIKLLPVPSAHDQDARARFQREIQTAGRLNHEAIVAATDAGTQDGIHYLVMELVQGMDLRHLAGYLGPLPIPAACELVRQAALGLSYAHGEGIVHRDIKPSNLMLDQSGRVKILDFGLAQLSFWDEAAVELTTVGQLMGTLDYMAPEQAERCGAVDYRVDLYALGATLFRLLCGRPPLAATPGLSPLEKLKMLARDRPPRLDTLRPDAPAELVSLVEQMLSKSPEDRPPSAAHVAEQLAPWSDAADLVHLLEQASSEAERQAEASSGSLRPAPRMPLAPAASAAGASGSGSRRRHWLAGAAASLLLAAAAAVMIVLELGKGQLVIQSEVADVHVRLLQDGQPVRQLQVQPGATTSRLRADRYEIVIDSPSDLVVVDQDRIELHRGETVVARITRRPAAAAEPGAPAAAVDDLTAVETDPGLLYAGKPLDHWLGVLRRDRSAESLGEALTAVSVLARPDTAERVSQALLETMRQLDGELLPIGEKPTQSFDELAFEILADVNSAKGLGAMLADSLQQADAAWGARILSAIFRLVRVGTLQLDEIDRPLSWLEQQVFVAGPETHSLFEQGLRFYFNLFLSRPRTAANSEELDAVDKRLLEVLDRFGQQAKPLWFAQLPGDRWVDCVRREVVRRAVNALSEDDLSESLTTQAIDILVNDVALALRLEPRLPKIADSRLQHLAEDQQTLLARLSLSRAFRQTLPNHLVSSPSSFRVGFSSRDGIAAGNPAISLIALLKTLPSNLRRIDGLERVLVATQGQHDSVAPSLSGRPPQIPILLDMPNLRYRRGGNLEQQALLMDVDPEDWMAYLIHQFAASVRDAHLKATLPDEEKATGRLDARVRSRQTATTSDEDTTELEKKPDSEMVAMARRILERHDRNGDGVLTEDEWSQMLIDPSEADTDGDGRITLMEYARWMEQRRASRSSAADADDDGAAAGEADSGLLYAGQPLDHWLGVLRRDRSPESLAKAMTAIRALARPDTAERISQTVLETMRQLDGEMRIPSSATRKSSFDDSALRLLQAANPGSQYYELLVQQFEGGHRQWNERLLQCSNLLRSNESLDGADVLLSWFDANVLKTDARRDDVSLDTVLELYFQWFFATRSAESEAMRQANDERLLAMLDLHRELVLPWWVKQPLDDDWLPSIRAAVVRRAAEALGQPTLTAELATQAAFIVRQEPQMAAQQVPELASHLNALLARIAEQPQRLLAITRVPYSFMVLTSVRIVPKEFKISIQRPTRGVGIGMSSERTYYRSGQVYHVEAIEALLLLELLTLIDELPAPLPGVQSIAEATADQYEELRMLLGAEYEQGFSVIIPLYWPDLRVDDRILKDTPRRVFPQLQDVYWRREFAESLVQRYQASWVATIIHFAGRQVLDSGASAAILGDVPAHVALAERIGVSEETAQMAARQFALLDSDRDGVLTSADMDQWRTSHSSSVRIIRQRLEESDDKLSLPDLARLLAERRQRQPPTWPDSPQPDR